MLASSISCTSLIEKHIGLPLFLVPILNTNVSSKLLLVQVFLIDRIDGLNCIKTKFEMYWQLFVLDVYR